MSSFHQSLWPSVFFLLTPHPFVCFFAPISIFFLLRPCGRDRPPSDICSAEWTIQFPMFSQRETPEIHSSDKAGVGGFC